MHSFIKTYMTLRCFRADLRNWILYLSSIFLSWNMLWSDGVISRLHYLPKLVSCLLISVWYMISVAQPFECITLKRPLIYISWMFCLCIRWWWMITLWCSGFIHLKGNKCHLLLLVHGIYVPHCWAHSPVRPSLLTGMSFLHNEGHSCFWLEYSPCYSRF